MTPFAIGDLVFHARYNGLTGNTDRDVGNVCGFCPGDKWVRVKTNDGRYRTWLKANVNNLDYADKTGDQGAVAKRIADRAGLGGYRHGKRRLTSLLVTGGQVCQK